MNTKAAFLVTFLFLTSAALACDAVEPVFEDYHTMELALTQDLPGIAIDGAKLLDEHAEHWLKEVPATDPRYTDVKIMQDSAKAIVALSAEKLKEIRIHFEAMSTAIISLIRKVPALQTDWQLYYCSMVKKFWVQPKTDKELMNPYAGTQMPHCGSKKPW
ncbi:MAG: DUF3347 domain-containing protein [Deltaproteobacteria bacterium]|nr:DUF3347 domain-containing protein [Deltaproteobacteria bacterium]